MDWTFQSDGPRRDELHRRHPTGGSATSRPGWVRPTTASVQVAGDKWRRTSASGQQERVSAKVQPPPLLQVNQPSSAAVHLQRAAMRTGRRTPPPCPAIQARLAPGCGQVAREPLAPRSIAARYGAVRAARGLRRPRPRPAAAEVIAAVAAAGRARRVASCMRRPPPAPSGISGGRASATRPEEGRTSERTSRRLRDVGPRRGTVTTTGMGICDSGNTSPLFCSV